MVASTISEGNAEKVVDTIIQNRIFLDLNIIVAQSTILKHDIVKLTIIFSWSYRILKDLIPFSGYTYYSCSNCSIVILTNRMSSGIPWHSFQCTYATHSVTSRDLEIVG